MATKYDGNVAERRALDLFIKLMRTHGALTAHLHQLMNHYELQASQFGILETLYHLGPLQQHELASKLLQTPGNITRILDKLEAERLVLRQSEPGDRRCHRIALTRLGEKRIRTIFPHFAKAMRDLFDCLTMEEQQQLNDLLRKLGKNLAYSLNKMNKTKK